MNVAIGYAFLGLLIGLLCGLSSSPIASVLLATIFTFIGGSIAYIIDRKSGEQRLVGAVLTAFSAFCTLGLVVGIITKDNRLLSFRDLSEAQYSGDREYFKRGELDAVNAIDLRYVNGDISAQQAYGELRAEITQPTSAEAGR